MQNVDVAFLILGGTGLWLLYEIWMVLKDIRKELNPKKYRRLK